jgi:hypothetical protein
VAAPHVIGNMAAGDWVGVGVVAIGVLVHAGSTKATTSNARGTSLASGRRYGKSTRRSRRRLDGPIARPDWATDGFSAGIVRTRRSLDPIQGRSVWRYWRTLAHPKRAPPEELVAGVTVPVITSFTSGLA